MAMQGHLARSLLIRYVDDTPTLTTSVELLAMFNNSKNVVINGGTFSVGHRQNGRSGLELLKEGIAPGAFHNSSERYDPPKCHPQTRLAVLEAIMNWIKDGQKISFIMWLYGPAGAGKSAIAQTIAEMCHRLGILAASFFWSRSAAGRNNETRLIASLAYQLIVTIPPIRPYVEMAIESDPLLLSRSLEAQMESLIIEPLEKIFHNNQEQTLHLGEPKLVILDGLDECGEPSAQEYILKMISTAIQRFPIRIHILIASRPEQEIRNSFNVKPLLPITTPLCLDNTYFPDDDIRLFLIDSFKNVKEGHALRSLLPTVWPTTQDIDTLVQKSSGQFIYAATVVKFVKSLRRRPDEQLEIILGIVGTGRQTPYAELDALYLHIFGMVEDLPRALEIMSYLFFLRASDYAQLDVVGIEELFFYKRGDLHIILSDLHSVLDVPDLQEDMTLDVFHASLQDFLMDSTRSGTFFLDESKARAKLTQYFMKHICNWSTSSLAGYSTYLPTYLETGDNDYDGTDLQFHSQVDQLVAREFIPNCLKAAPTPDLLRDFLSFDFKPWVSATALTTPSLEEDPWYDPLEIFEQVMMLSDWFREKESIVKEHLGPDMSLYAHHAHERDMAINKLLESALEPYFDRVGMDYRKIGRCKMSAITHPLLLDDKNRTTMRYLIGHKNQMTQRLRYDPELRLFPPASDESAMPPERIFEIQQFLRNRSRAGSCYVDGGMLTELSLHIGKVIFEPPLKDNYYRGRAQQVLQLAVDVLPFYLLSADYTSELADYFLSHSFDPETPKSFYTNKQPLLKAISNYCNRKPHVKEPRPRDEISEVPRKRQRK